MVSKLKVLCSSKLACNLLLFVMVCALAFSGVARSSKAAVLTTVYVLPETVTEISEVTFTIDVKVRFVYLMSGYQIYLSWNPAVLKYVNAIESPFLSNDSMYETTFIKKPNNNLGLVKIWGAQIGGDYGTAVGGNATLFTVTLTAIGTGQCKLNLHETQLFLTTNEFNHNVEDGFFDNKHHNAVWDDTTYIVVTESNSTVTDFAFNQSGYGVYFNVTGEEGTVGYVNITIPKSLLKVDTGILDPPPHWRIIINKTTPMVIDSWAENATHSFVYFTYPHSEHQIEIKGNWVVPEFPQFMLPLILLALTMLILLAKKFYGRGRGSTTVLLRKAS